MESDDISFSRINRTGDEVTELRVHVARFKLAVLDSVAISETRSTGKYTSRAELVDRILTDFISRKVEESNLIQSVIKNHPTMSEEIDD